MDENTPVRWFLGVMALILLGCVIGGVASDYERHEERMARIAHGCQEDPPK